MDDTANMVYNPTANKLVDVLCQKTQSTNRLFFNIMVSYYFCKVASMMRTSIQTHDRGRIPINLYAINLASSGEGKGHSTNIVEEQVIHLFRERFTDETFLAISEVSLSKLALKRSVKNGNSEDDELLRAQKEFELLGTLAFSFDSATSPAVKQMRHKLLMAGAGSVNMEIDEIGSNLTNNIEVLNTFLELFDVGKVKQKLTKNTAENIRGEDIDGKTPTNMMLFGTPAKLLNGGKTEDEFFSMLETGFARRCLFGYSKLSLRKDDLTPNEVYDMLTDNSTDQYLEQLADQMADLADRSNFETVLRMSKQVSLLLIEYRIRCEKLAKSMADHDEIRKAEMSHRYFKALKLAGAYAFIDGCPDLTENHLYSAIKVVEDSGSSFTKLLTRERNYAKLANYIASVGRDVTHVEMVEDLPFYKGSENARREMMSLAIAFGYKNNIIIKRTVTDGIEFLRGETIKQTNIEKMIVSYGKHLAEGYLNQTAKFSELHRLVTQTGFHWVAHHLIDGQRREENAISGFNLVVLDVDEGTSIPTVQLLLGDYQYLIHTTKRHTDAKHRFRVILPMSHTLKMDATEYKEFMLNIYSWMPFSVDEQTNQRARKWLSHPGQHIYNDGCMLDALQFIPRTSKNEERKQRLTETQSLSNIERWFIDKTGTGNRSNQMIKYALMLVDSGRDLDEIRNEVLLFNGKLPDKLDEIEIMSTIMATVSKAIIKRESPQ